jgi:plastocyanin
VTWDGEIPKPQPFSLPLDFKDRRPEEAAFCGECAERGVLRHEDLEVDSMSRGVRNVAASVSGVTGDVTALPPAVLDNKECRFEPHVQFVAVGRPLAVRNSDGFVHNARILGRSNQEFWNALIAPGKSVETRPFVISGTYTVICDVHPWMKATVIAVKHPFCAVTAPDGAATISGIPPGEGREIVLWHETLGVARLTVDLKPGETIERALTQKTFRKP